MTKWEIPSSETQGHIERARQSLNGQKNMGQRKVKNSEKSPWGQCLTRPVPNGRRCSDFWLVPENFCVFLPNQKAERWQLFGTGLVRHCPQGLFSLFFTFLRAIFFCPFRLSLTPTIYPWVSEDGEILATTNARWKWATAKIVNENTYNSSSIKRVTKKFLEVSPCSHAKQRQRKVCCTCKVAF